MITPSDFEYLKRVRRFGGTAPRSSGQTFRNLLQAAHVASVGDRVTMWCNTEFIAKDECTKFMDMFHNWGFQYVAPRWVRQKNSSGSVLFSGLPTDYQEYQRRTRGINILEIFDI